MFGKKIRFNSRHGMNLSGDGHGVRHDKPEVLTLLSGRGPLELRRCFFKPEVDSLTGRK